MSINPDSSSAPLSRRSGLGAFGVVAGLVLALAPFEAGAFCLLHHFPDVLGFDGSGSEMMALSLSIRAAAIGALCVPLGVAMLVVSLVALARNPALPPPLPEAGDEIDARALPA